MISQLMYIDRCFVKYQCLLQEENKRKSTQAKGSENKILTHLHWQWRATNFEEKPTNNKYKPHLID